MRNLPALVTYEQVFDLCVQLAGRSPDNVPAQEATMLRAFFAAELPDLWRKEAWPELCAIAEQTLTANVFSKHAGTNDEIGEVLGVFTQDPRSTAGWQRFPADKVIEGDGEVRVATSLGTVWVESMSPVPDLLDPALDVEATLLAAELPGRFRLVLAFRGAAHLLSSEDPELANKYLTMAENELTKLAAPLTRPYWRQEVRGEAPMCGLTTAAT